MSTNLITNPDEISRMAAEVALANQRAERARATPDSVGLRDFLRRATENRQASNPISGRIFPGELIYQSIAPTVDGDDLHATQFELEIARMAAGGVLPSPLESPVTWSHFNDVSDVPALGGPAPSRGVVNNWSRYYGYPSAVTHGVTSPTQFQQEVLQSMAPPAQDDFTEQEWLDYLWRNFQGYQGVRAKFSDPVSARDELIGHKVRKFLSIRAPEDFAAEFTSIRGRTQVLDHIGRGRAPWIDRVTAIAAHVASDPMALKFGRGWDLLVATLAEWLLLVRTRDSALSFALSLNGADWDAFVGGRPTWYAAWGLPEGLRKLFVLRLARCAKLMSNLGPADGLPSVSFIVENFHSGGKELDHFFACRSSGGLVFSGHITQAAERAIRPYMHAIDRAVLRGYPTADMDPQMWFAMNPSPRERLADLEVTTTPTDKPGRRLVY